MVGLARSSVAQVHRSSVLLRDLGHRFRIRRTPGHRVTPRSLASRSAQAFGSAGIDTATFAIQTGMTWSYPKVQLWFFSSVSAEDLAYASLRYGFGVPTAWISLTMTSRVDEVVRSGSGPPQVPVEQE